MGGAVPESGSRKGAHPVKSRKRISSSDVKLTLLLPFILAVSWLIPSRFWPSITRNVLVRESAGASEDSVRRGVRLSGLSNELRLSGADISKALQVHRYVSYFQYLKDYRPGRWPCRYDIEAEDRLRSALGQGTGVILWVAHFVFNGLPLKKALSQAGYQVYHLSRPEHGFSDTRYGIRILNPIRSRIEMRYLTRRIIIKRGSEHVALREAHRLASSGAIVSITAGHWEGRQIAQLPIGEARLPISVGAPSLAHATSAPLLPVFIRMKEDGGFYVGIGSAITCSAFATRDEAVTAALGDFSEQLRAEIKRSPDQWRGWKYLTGANTGKHAL
jgi:hypothetical protein